MIFISGVMSIIIQKNMLCANKIRMIYFCPNFVNFCHKTFFFLVLTGFLDWFLYDKGLGHERVNKLKYVPPYHLPFDFKLNIH